MAAERETMTMPTCQSCKFFSALKQQCRAEPPKTFMIAVDPQRGPIFAGAFVPVGKDDWCGKHEPQLSLAH